MEQITTSSSPPSPKELKVVESQIRELFARTVYSHKTHEKSADAATRAHGYVKWIQLLLSAVTTGGIVFAIVKNSSTTSIVSASVSTVLMILNAYMKERDWGQVALKHKDAADKLWAIRESYLSLLVDIRTGGLGLEEIRRRRDELQHTLSSVYSAAPRTDPYAYQNAGSALKDKEELTFSEGEIDRFLPAPLRNSSSKTLLPKSDAKDDPPKP